MLLHSTRDILKALSQGHIGWREAARRLKLERFDEVEALLKAHGLPLYQPEEGESRRRMDALDRLLYSEDEL